MKTSYIIALVVIAGIFLMGKAKAAPQQDDGFALDFGFRKFG